MPPPPPYNYYSCLMAMDICEVIVCDLPQYQVVVIDSAASR